MFNAGYHAELLLKIVPPRLPKKIILRDRLSSREPHFADKSLIEIQAPPGYGKTLLLGQWRSEALQDGEWVAWLSLDGISDDQSFAVGLAYAMRQASGLTRFDDLGQQMQGEGLANLTLWLAEISHLGRKSLLILDDVHRANSASMIEALQYLFLNLPSNLRLIYASRTSLPLPIVALKAKGFYAHIDSDPLRFTLFETTELINRYVKGDIPHQMALDLHEKVAGWPLGIQLAMSTLEKQSLQKDPRLSVTSVIDDFGQYFQTILEVGYSAEDIDFLCKIAVLDTLQSELGREVSGYADAEIRLIKLAEQLPIFSESSDKNGLRLHPLAREYLQARLRAQSEKIWQDVHLRAARWYALNDMLEVAASHALTAGNHRYAHTLMGKCLYRELISGNQMRVLYWLKQLPRAELEKQPRTLLSAAWALAESENHAQAAMMVKKILKHPAATTQERFECVLIQCAAAYYADDIDTTNKLITPWIDKTPEMSPGLRGIYNNVRGMVLLYQGRPEQTRHLIRATHSESPTTILTIRDWGEWLIGLTYLWEGQIYLAIDVLSRSLNRVESMLGRRSALSVKHAAPLSFALFEAGKISEAEAMIADRLDILEKISSPEAVSFGYQSAGRIAARHMQHSRAIDLLTQLYAVGESHQFVRLKITSLTEQISFHAQHGHGELCNELAKRLLACYAEIRAPKFTLLMPLMQLRMAIAMAYAHIAVGRWRSAEEALTQSFGDALSQALLLKRGREAIEIRLLRALSLHHQRRDGSALAQEAISLAKFLGQNATIAHRMPQWFADLLPDIAHDAAPSIKPPLSEANPKPSHPTKASSGLLTVKETEVLRLLERNFSNKQIANVLNVSHETVKWHVKNLFIKLNAGSRKHVVDRAILLGI